MSDSKTDPDDKSESKDEEVEVFSDPLWDLEFDLPPLDGVSADTYKNRREPLIDIDAIREYLGLDIPKESDTSKKKAKRESKAKSFSVNEDDLKMFSKIKDTLLLEFDSVNDSEVFRMCISHMAGKDAQFIKNAFSALTKRKLGRKIKPVAFGSKD